jgi:hypothetical protein
MRPDAGRCQVVRATESGDRVEQHNNVVTELDKTLGALDGKLGDNV